MASFCKFIGAGIFCSYSCPHRSGHNVPYKPPTRQMLFLALQLLISICMGKCYSFKVRALRTGLSCIFQSIGNILLQKVQSQHDSAQATKHEG